MSEEDVEALSEEEEEEELERVWMMLVLGEAVAEAEERRASERALYCDWTVLAKRM